MQHNILMCWQSLCAPAFTAQALHDGGFIDGRPEGAAGTDQTGQMTAARWQTGYEQLKPLGILEGPVDPTSAYTLKFIQ
jgi:hypothetical protein